MRVIAALAAALVLGAESGIARADQDPPEPTSRPVFEELNRETQSLFRQIAPSIARVQMPQEFTLIIPTDDLLSKYRLEPEVRRRLMEMQRNGGETLVHAEIVPTTNPSAIPDTGHIIVMQLSHFAPNNIGIVMDDQQHLLVPHYVSKEAFAEPVPLVLANGRFGTASFVASDRQSDVTILQLQDVKGAPVKLADHRPDPGALLLLLSLNPASNRLVVWEGWEPDLTAVIDIEGTVAGFTKGGRFFSATPYAGIAQELVQNGRVRRPFLGVSVNMVMQDDPQRQSDPSLGTAPALRILQVVPGSAADKAGLRANDLILKLAGQSVGDTSTFAAMIANHRGKTEMTLFRDGQRLTVTIDLEVQ